MTSALRPLRLALCAALLLAPSARAWDDVGHEVVSQLAWQQMTPAAREMAAELLLAAPADARLRQLQPATGSEEEQARILFLRASTWPDKVRDEPLRSLYHQGTWHYINYFWEVGWLTGRVSDRPDMVPPSPNIVEVLERLSKQLAAPKRPPAEKAIDLAWVLHLMGDIQQPLHCSARVTFREGRGDRGGNDFALRPPPADNLHAYWDRILSTSYPRAQGETEDAQVRRIADELLQRYPPAALSAELDAGDYDGWARAGFATAKAVVYPPSLKRDSRPSESYRKQALETSGRAVALGGYRLAALLNELFAPEEDENAADPATCGCDAPGTGG